MNIGSMRWRRALLLLLLALSFAGQAEGENDALRTDSLAMRQCEQKRQPAVPFSYKNVRDYIFGHLNYPAQAVEEEIEGTVLIRFTLMKSGDIDSVEVIAPVHPLLDREALRLIRNMPKWEPVYLQGQPVELSYEVPVIFELLPAAQQDSLK